MARIEIEVAKEHAAVDPELLAHPPVALAVIAPPQPPGSQNRFTVVVPAGHTQLNLGLPASDAEAMGFSVTTDADASLSGGQSVQLTSSGFITIAATHADRGAFAAGFASVADTIASNVRIAVGLGIAALAVAASTARYKHAPKDGKPGRKGWLNVGGMATFLLKTGALVARGVKLGRGWSRTDIPGRIAVHAAESAVIYASESVTLQGLSIDANGLMTASISAPMADLRGFAVATVWGGYKATLSGAMHATVQADLGSVRVLGHKSAELSSQTDKVFIHGMKDVQINSNDESVFVHGKKGVYVVAGSGVKLSRGQGEQDYADANGMAVDVLDDKIRLGFVFHANRFQEHEFSDFGSKVEITQDDFAVDAASMKLSLRKRGFQVEGPMLNGSPESSVVMDYRGVRVTTRGRVLLQ